MHETLNKEMVWFIWKGVTQIHSFWKPMLCFWTLLNVLLRYNLKFHSLALVLSNGVTEFNTNFAPPLILLKCLNLVSPLKHSINPDKCFQFLVWYDFQFSSDPGSLLNGSYLSVSSKCCDSHCDRKIDKIVEGLTHERKKYKVSKTHKNIYLPW